jgi:S-adenosyl methyltransferase
MRVERVAEPSGEDGSDHWTTAGIRDCWLGGSHHTSAERELAERIPVGVPQLPYLVRVYRELLGRVVRYLVRVEVHQFLDLGSGLPTAGNVHEVAQGLDSQCRVVYVDSNPHVVARSHALLAGIDNAAVICADLRQPGLVFDAAQQTGLLDMTEPIAVLLIDVLHHIPDTDDPAGFIAAYIKAVCSDSYVAVAHTIDDGENLATGLAMFRRLYYSLAPPLTFRNPVRAADFFTGLDIVEPGIVPIPLWRSEPDDDFSSDVDHFPAWCGLGRKS